MTDRTERGGGSRGRKTGPRRPGMGGRPPRPEAPKRDDRDEERKPWAKGAPSGTPPPRPRAPRGGQRADDREQAPRATGKPGSKRFGRRPPGAERIKSDTARPGRPASRGARTEGVGPSKGGDRRFRTDRPLRGDQDRGAKRHIGRGPNRDSKRGRKAEEGVGDGRIRLNRFLSNAGVASRREADALIQAGVVQVNGVIVTELGTKVGPDDRIHYGGQRLSTEKKRYVLVNKPKDFITTTDDPQDRRTVMALIDDACTERLYPVGRLDRNTTGLLLMTNDGDLAKRLTHPSHGAEKIYHVTLDKSVTKADLEQLVKGVELDDGPASAEEASFVQSGGTKREVGLKLHMGRNRVVRRMFEALGYEVMKLDRVVFAGLTKKDLPRGNWRHLTEKEVLFLTKRK